MVSACLQKRSNSTSDKAAYQIRAAQQQEHSERGNDKDVSWSHTDEAVSCVNRDTDQRSSKDLPGVSNFDDAAEPLCSLELDLTTMVDSRRPYDPLSGSIGLLWSLCRVAVEGYLRAYAVQGWALHSRPTAVVNRPSVKPNRSRSTCTPTIFCSFPHANSCMSGGFDLASLKVG